MSNDNGFVKVTLIECCHFHDCSSIQNFTYLELPTLRICLCFLRVLLDMLVGTVTDYLSLGWRPHMDKKLFYRGAEAWNNIDQTLYLATSLKTF